MTTPNRSQPDSPSQEVVLGQVSERLQQLGVDTDLETVHACLQEVRALVGSSEPGIRALAREAAKEALGRVDSVRSPASVADAFLEADRAASSDSQDSGDLFQDPAEWPEPVSGSELLDALQETFETYLALPEGASVALSLWTVHAHAHEASVISPVLSITSPVMRCGKTTVLELLGALVPRPLMASNLTAPSLFRVVDRYRPTVLIDEADTFLFGKDDLRGVLNSGHRKGTANVVRLVGDRYEPKTFSTWAPKAIALIGKLPGALGDRSIEIRMRRKLPGERVSRLRLDRLEQLEHLRSRAWTWTQRHLASLRAAEPHVPAELHDRAADNWRTLLSIADVAGGSWPEKGREAALLLTPTDEESGGRAVLLLADVWELFESTDSQRLASRFIVDELGGREDRPWAEWQNGQPITTRQLAGLLQPFGLGPRALWIEGQTKQGYERGDFAEPVKRYVGAQEAQGPQGAADRFPVPELHTSAHDGCERASSPETQEGEESPSLAQQDEDSCTAGAEEGLLDQARLDAREGLDLGGEDLEFEGFLTFRRLTLERPELPLPVLRDIYDQELEQYRRGSRGSDSSEGALHSGLAVRETAAPPQASARARADQPESTRN